MNETVQKGDGLYLYPISLIARPVLFFAGGHVVIWEYDERRMMWTWEQMLNKTFLIWAAP